ncbi:TetR/AcrR family transcriptional regulator [Glycomyces sp. TRM65418]|uniref:TetR/AcrR family transcriptional regulator n=1 Tax=Glycomyces sp. TRM65418 TaxID=2867006 RepID=UPI001D15E741|nr:TetR/AcrR family transcriptional regulator [Glycomyces sp. TRM65418]MCC3765600.1 TetR/AcrR family transcriptional regulator [Glycomyces sp. TRM65418]
MPTEKTLRAGSAQKRSAILSSARELFLTEGFDRTSVDAIAAHAGVSKRTVYDYFGDKQTLLHAVFDAVGQSLLATIRHTLEDTLDSLADPAELEPALVAFSLRITTDMLDSVEYTALQRFVRTASGHLPHPDDRALTNAPEEAMGERFAALAEAGLLEVPDPRLAADHFIALTFGVTLSRLGSANAAKDSRVRPLIVEGVRAFLRAYRTG